MNSSAEFFYPGGVPDIYEYEELIEDMAYFREVMPHDEQIPYLQTRLNEEIDELLRPSAKDIGTEKISLLWGREHANSQRQVTLKQELVTELGDCLYYVVACAHIKEISLSQIIKLATAKFCPADTPTPATITAFDDQMAGKMEASLPDTYNPDYFWLQNLNMSPYYPDKTDGSPTISGDGYYALHSVLTNVSNFLWLDSEEYIEKAADALAVISAVTQTRLDSSLAEVVQKNSQKLARRRAEGTLQEGIDNDRERLPNQARPNYTTWSNTLARLVFVEMPEATK